MDKGIADNNRDFSRFKLVKLLKVLSKEEFLRFGKFLRSPFFNYTPSLIQFYESLKRHHPTFDSPRLKIEKLWAKAFPDKPFHPQKFRQLCSDLSRMTEKYLIQLELEEPQGKAQHLLIQSLGRRNEYSLFKKESQKWQEKLESQSYKDTDYYLDLAQLEYNLYSHPKTNKYLINPDSLDKIMDGFDNHYFTVKLKFGSELITRESYLKEEHPIKLLEEIKSICESDSLKSNPLIQIYLLIHKLNSTEASDEIFQEAKTLFQTKIKELKKEDRIDIYLQLLNFSIRKVNSGNGSFNAAALDLFKTGLHYNLVLIENQISETTFTNVVSFGCYEKEFDWTRKFIQDYEQFLAAKVRADSKTLSLVLLHFWKGDYESVIDLMTDYKFSLFLKEIVARTYLLRAWYEKFLLDDDLFGFLFNKIKTFDQFIRRNKNLSENRKDGYLNFARILAQLVYFKSRNSENKEELVRLINSINEQNRLVAKSWFIEKLK